MPGLRTVTKRASITRCAAQSKQPSGNRPRSAQNTAPAAPQSGGRHRRPVGVGAANTKPRAQPKGRGKKKQTKQDLGDMQLERQRPPHHRARALIEAVYTGKRRASSAYDDRIIKRRRTALVRLPLEAEHVTGPVQHGQEIEKPGCVLQNLTASGDFDDQPTAADRMEIAQACNIIEDPVAAMGLFTRLPTEVRDMIFRNLLVYHRDIRVLRGWSLVFPRSRPNLETNLLRVCRVFHRQSIRILYSENTFLYLNRDPSAWKSDTDIVIQHVYDRGHIPIDKYGHLIRRIKIVVEANRMQQHDSRVNLPNALQKFLPGQGGVDLPAQLHTITIELPAQTRRMLGMADNIGTNRSDVPICSWFRQGSSVLNALQTLNCQFISILAYNHRNEYFEVLIDRRAHFSQLSADEGNFDIWKYDDIMLNARQDNAKRSRVRLSTLYHWLEQLAGGLTDNDLKRGLRRDPMRSLLEGPFRHYIPQPDSSDPLEALPSGSSGRWSRRSAQAGFNQDTGGLPEEYLEGTDCENVAEDPDSSDTEFSTEDVNDDGDDDELFVKDRRGSCRKKLRRLAKFPCA